MKHIYFVSFAVVNQASSSFGFGSSEVETSSEIKSLSQVSEIAKVLEKKKPHYGTVTVLNFVLLRKERGRV